MLLYVTLGNSICADMVQIRPHQGVYLPPVPRICAQIPCHRITLEQVGLKAGKVSSDPGNPEMGS